MQPKSEKNVRAYGLPKTHKHYEQLPKFRSIIDTTNIPYYDILKFLSYLPNSLKGNQYVVEDSLSVAEKVSETPK